MKIRNDFVTNSSSSSFVIAYRKPPELDEETLVKYPFLKNYGNLIEKVLFFEGDCDTSAGKVYRTKEEWDKFILEEYGWHDNTLEQIFEDNDYPKDLYDKAVKCLGNGFNILEKSVDYNDTFCSNMLRELASDEENFIILEEYG